MQIQRGNISIQNINNKHYSMIEEIYIELFKLQFEKVDDKDIQIRLVNAAVAKLSTYRWNELVDWINKSPKNLFKQTV